MDAKYLEAEQRSYVAGLLEDFEIDDFDEGVLTPVDAANPHPVFNIAIADLDPEVELKRVY